MLQTKLAVAKRSAKRLERAGSSAWPDFLEDLQLLILHALSVAALFLFLDRWF